MHGLALNVERCSLEPFQHITPCGIVGVEMTCLEGEAGRSWTVEQTAAILADAFLQSVPNLSPTVLKQP
jgi:lipoyl(octanoyl) transferase